MNLDREFDNWAEDNLSHDPSKYVETAHEAFDAGFEVGYDEGSSDGYSEGYDNGYYDGLSAPEGKE